MVFNLNSPGLFGFEFLNVFSSLASLSLQWNIKNVLDGIKYIPVTVNLYVLPTQETWEYNSPTVFFSQDVERTPCIRMRDYFLGGRRQMVKPEQ